MARIGGSTTLRKKALLGFVRLQLALALLLFLPAWSLRFWQGWVYWALFGAVVLAVTLYLLERDPALVASRLAVGPRAEPARSQQLIQALAGLLACGLVVVPGIERQHHASLVPASLVLAADAVVLAGFGIGLLAFRANPHASSVIEVKPEQRVVATGPYALVRHPLYAAGVLIFLATPLALGSLWALAVSVPLCGAVAARLLDEERQLARDLPGYAEYQRAVPYRLIPRIW